MSRYIRPRVPGAPVFFTLTLADRRSRALVDHVGALREAVRQTMAKRTFRIDAWVVLPDHLHAVWTLPEGDADYSVRWRLIKARFSRELPVGRLRNSHEARQERGSGNAGSGNIISVTGPISRPISGIAGGTRSSTGWPTGQRIGHFRQSIAISGTAGMGGDVP